jgi:hypothetical protein
MRINQIKILQKFYSDSKKSEQNWLNGLSYSNAFVICIGAGPWKITRRQKIQQLALNKLNNQDISTLDKVDWYPLDWQNKILNNLIENIKNSDFSTFEELCIDHKEQAKEYPFLIRSSISSYCGYEKEPPKVISLFMRDALKIPSFPIDRHVKRKLKELELPTKEYKIIDLCIEANLDPRMVAYAFVNESSGMENPNWQDYSLKK